MEDLEFINTVSRKILGFKHPNQGDIGGGSNDLEPNFQKTEKLASTSELNVFSKTLTLRKTW